MSEKMKAVVAYGPEDYKVESVDIPKAGFEEVIIKIGACGICGSDMKAYHGASMFWGGENPWMKAPVIPGHEFFGTVVELGEGAAENMIYKSEIVLSLTKLSPVESADSVNRVNIGCVKFMICMDSKVVLLMVEWQNT